MSRFEASLTGGAFTDVSTPEVTMVNLQPRQINGQRLAQARGSIGETELVASFDGPVPVGVAVSLDGRIFVTFPRAFDQGEYTLAEWRDSQPVPFPDLQMQQMDNAPQHNRLLSAQGITVDAHNRLWVLDTGKIDQQPVSHGGPKLVCIDLERNAVIKSFVFPEEVAGPQSWLNDVRIDLRQGFEGMAFITDASEQGPNGIVVLDFATGSSWRRLHDHPSTKAEPGFLAIVESEPHLKRPPAGAPEPITVGTDGIALSGDGERLYYCPNASRRLYSVSLAALGRAESDDEVVAATVRDEGEKGAADGLLGDADNRLYITSYEHNAILRRSPDGQIETLVSGAHILWPDSLAIGPDGYLYFTANQLHRHPRYHQGEDRREKPYPLFRTRIDARPVLLA